MASFTLHLTEIDAFALRIAQEVADKLSWLNAGEQIPLHEESFDHNGEPVSDKALLDTLRAALRVAVPRDLAEDVIAVWLGDHAPIAVCLDDAARRRQVRPVWPGREGRDEADDVDDEGPRGDAERFWAGGASWGLDPEPAVLPTEADAPDAGQAD